MWFDLQLSASALPVARYRYYGPAAKPTMRFENVSLHSMSTKLCLTSFAITPSLPSTKPEDFEVQTEIFKQKRREYRQKLAAEAQAAQANEASA